MRKHNGQLRRIQGFTLIELMVAISIMALMAVLSWRSLSGMTQAQTRLQQRADEVLTLQAGLAQWGIDLDEMVQLPQNQAMDWDGRALRLTRRSSSEDGVLVVAWSRRDVDGTGQWLRWQSPPLRGRDELHTAWAAAAQWAQNPGDDLKKREVSIIPVSQWQVFFYRSDAWTNPLSSSGMEAGAAPASAVAPARAVAPATVASASAAPVTAAPGNAAAPAPAVAPADAQMPSLDAVVPEGIRLVLTLAPGQAMGGTLTRDWLRPTLGGGKS
jgi:general secretion pathway protein J